MVFDLGGGTFDVTILRTREDGTAEVLASEGDRHLGGKDVDEMIEGYLYDAFLRANGTEIPLERAFEVQRHALQAKLTLSDHPEARVQLSFPEGDLDVTLKRARPGGAARAAYDVDVDDPTFYLEDRLQSFLQRCRVLCLRALERAAFETPAGPRPMRWADLDEIVLSGGSCRIPAVRQALADWSGMPVRQPAHFDLDTAVAIGAALHGAHRERVKDVVSHSVGVKLVDPQGRLVIDHLLKKNEPLPARAERSYPAPANGELQVYQGESRRPDEALLRGRLALGNPAGRVTVRLHADLDGTLAAEVQWGDTVRPVPIENALYDFDERALALRERVLGVHINL
jgi:molecular chaperone DnaK